MGDQLVLEVADDGAGADGARVAEASGVGLAHAAGEDGERHVALRGAAGKQAGGEQHAQQGAALACGHQGAEAIQRMRHLFAPEAEEQRADRRVGQVVERRERALAERAEHELAEGGGGQGEHNGIEFRALHGVALVPDDFPRAARDQAGDGGTRANDVARGSTVLTTGQGGGQGRGQRLQAALERNERDHAR